jgi:NADPH:quinone reductase-like Zn-dependent oxidoreductase
MQQPSVNTSATTSRAVQLESFGGPEVLNLREVPAPQAGSGQIRVRVTAAGLNPMDWFMTSDAETATRFGLSLPSGFGTDYAGVVDQVGDGVTEFAAGDRVFGGALSRAVADYVVIDVAGTIAAGGDAHHTPDGVDDRTAAILAIGGCTAAAALAVVKPGPGDTLLIGGAGGGVGVFAVQLARLAGARVIATGSATSLMATAWSTGSVPWLPPASLRRSTYSGRTRRRRHENLAFRTSASPPSLHRSTGSRRQTALMPPPAP